MAASKKQAPETAEQPEQPAKPKHKGGRPRAGTDRIPIVESFFNAARRFTPADWGTRVWISVYRTRPLIDRLRAGQPKKIGKYGQFIDEEWLKHEHGSGTYRLFLNVKETADPAEKQVASVEVDIFDPKYPPNIPDTQWLDITENRDWEWCRPLLKKTTPDPPAPAAAPSSLGEVVGAFQVFSEIQKNASDTARQAQPPATPAPQQPAENPMVAGLSIARELLTLRADNPMVDVLKEQVAALRTELSEQRKLNQEFLTKLNDKSAAASDPLSTLKVFFDGFKALRDQAADVLPQSTGRSRMGPLAEWSQPIVMRLTEVLEPVFTAVGNSIANSLQPANANPGRPQIVRPTSEADQTLQLVDEITPRMLRFLREYDDETAPGAFAMWFHEGYGEQARLAIDKVVSAGGAAALMNWYRRSKYWTVLSPIENDFQAFLEAVIAWQPERDRDQDHEPAPADASDQPIVEIDAEPEPATA